MTSPANGDHMKRKTEQNRPTDSIRAKKFRVVRQGGRRDKASTETEMKPRQLSRREQEIVVLVAQGYTNREVGERMSISEQTVKSHVHNIFVMLGLTTRLELALYAIDCGLHVDHREVKRQNGSAA